MSDPRPIDKMTIEQLKRELNAANIKFDSKDLKPALVQKLKEAGNKNAARLKGAEKTDTEKSNARKNDAEKPDAKKPDAEKPDAEKPDAEKANARKNDAEKPDAEKPDAEKPDAENQKTDNEKTDAEKTEKGNAAELNGGKTEGTSKKGSVRNLSDNNAPATSGTGGDNLDDEYEKALAKLKEMQIGSEPEDSTKKKLDEAKKKFVELLKSGASIDDLNKSQEAIEKLKSLSKPKTYDQEGYVIYSSPSDPTILLKRVIWTDPGMKRAMITCGPTKAAIWRVVTLAEARAYEGFASAGDWAFNRVKSEDTQTEKKTTSAEARQIIGIGFARPIVVGLSMDKVFEKRSPKSRQEKVKSLPANSTEDIKSIVASKHRRHVHIIMSYEREGMRFKKPLPFTHWLKVAGFQDPEKDPAGLNLVKGAAEYEQSAWEAWLEQEHPDSYMQLEEAGLEFESEDEKILQDSRDNTPDSRESTPATARVNGTKVKKSGNVLQDSRDNTPDTLDNSRESTPGIPTPGTRGSTPDDTHDDAKANNSDAKTNNSDTKTNNSDKEINPADVAKPTTETSDT